jgi:predicted PurR-regulated permease PerM
MTDEKVVALPMPKSNAKARPPRISTVTSIVLTVGVLYFAQEVLIPLALSFMLMFLLAPLVTRLERWGLQRVWAVLTVAVVTFGTITLVGWIVVRQVISLAEDLPRYQDEIVRKAVSLQGTGGTVGSNIDRLGKELEKAAG